MQINGFNKTTLFRLSRPRSLYCFSPEAATSAAHFARMVIWSCMRGGCRGFLKKIFQVLRSGRGILTGICVTGGEPRFQPDLDIFLSRVKELGYLVKLDSNGYRPRYWNHCAAEAGGLYCHGHKIPLLRITLKPSACPRLT